MSAANGNYSLDSPIPGDDPNGNTLADNCSISEQDLPDAIVEKENLYFELYQAIDGLTIIEQKLIKMKGIDSYGQ